MNENIKRILVPVDPSEYAGAAAESACRIAGIHKAQVSGVAVLDSAEIRSSLVPAVGPYYPMVMKEVLAKKRHANDILKDCLDRFAQICEEMQVSHLETEYEGIPAQKLLESAIFYDLMVVGLRTSFHFETRKSNESLDSLLERTITPILAVPATGLEKPEYVIAAIDGSFGSARALQDFIRYAQPYNPRIKVVVAGREKNESDFLRKNAKALLVAHGFEKIETEAIDCDIAEGVDKEIASGANLVVAGIHSKRVIKDLFVGSFTRGLIQRGDIPLFLSH